MRAIEASRLTSGSHARVAGRLAGRSVEFDVDVLDASAERLDLIANGPSDLGVRYVLSAQGDRSAVDASVSVEDRALLGRVFAKAAEALLAGGAPRLSLDRLRRSSSRSSANPVRWAWGRLAAFCSLCDVRADLVDDFRWDLVHPVLIARVVTDLVEDLALRLAFEHRGTARDDRSALEFLHLPFLPSCRRT